jgi:acetyl esterase
LRDLPPALIITDEDDPMRDEAEKYAGHLTKDGVQAKVSRYPMMIHGFFLMAGYLNDGKKCIDETAKALRDAFESVPQTISSTRD